MYTLWLPFVRNKITYYYVENEKKPLYIFLHSKHLFKHLILYPIRVIQIHKLPVISLEMKSKWALLEPYIDIIIQYCFQVYIYKNHH